MKQFRQIFVIFSRFLLEWVATLLPFLIFPIYFLTEIYHSIEKRAFFIHLSSKSLDNAVQLDIFYNTHYARLWNYIFKRKEGHRFGGRETLSEAMAHNMKIGKLTVLGWIIAFIINVFDVPKWFKGGHFKELAV